MITTGILTLFYAFVNWAFSPIISLPDASLPAGFDNAMAQATTYLSMANAIVPISTLITILTLLVSIEVGIFIYKVIMWVVKKIPTIS